MTAVDAPELQGTHLAAPVNDTSTEAMAAKAVPGSSKPRRPRMGCAIQEIRATLYKRWKSVYRQ